VVDANKDGIPVDAVVQLLQRPTKELKEKYNLTEDCGKFMVVSSKMIEDVIEAILQEGVIQKSSSKKTLSGTLKRGAKLKPFVYISANCTPFSEILFQGNIEYSVVNTLNRNPDIADEMTEKILADNLLWLSEHPAVYCKEKYAVERIARSTPTKYKEYLKKWAMREEDSGKSRYMRVLADL
jgi:hypothetical protein